MGTFLPYHAKLCDEGGGAHPPGAVGAAEAVSILDAANDQCRPAPEGTQVGIGADRGAGEERLTGVLPARGRGVLALSPGP